MSEREFERILNNCDKNFVLIDNFLNQVKIDQIGSDQLEDEERLEENLEGEEDEEDEEMEYEIRNSKSCLRLWQRLLKNTEKLQKHSNQIYFHLASNFLEKIEKNKEDFEQRINNQIVESEINNFLEKRGKRDFNRLLNALQKNNPTAAKTAKNQLTKDVEQLKKK